MSVFSSFFFLKKRIKIQGSMPSCKKWKPTQSSDFKRFANSQNRLRICSRFCMGLFFKQSCMMPSLETVFLVHCYAYRFNSDFKSTSFWTWFRIFLNPNTSPNGLIKWCVKNKGASNALAVAKTIWCLSAASSKRRLENLIFLAWFDTALNFDSLFQDKE